MTLETIKDHLRTGQLDKASEAIRSAEKNGGNNAEVAFLRGYLQELNYETDPALASYQKALEQQPEHVDAAFRSAFLTDLGGDDDAAIALYERCVSQERVPVSVLLNLAVLYEEQGSLKKAEACLNNVLEEYPNHARARHFLKSVQSSFLMMVDERGQREREQHSAILDQPITDFELSVRSRNCLRQMNIRTVGDLVRTSEAELLAYKNFGETSLNEIKALLVQKNLKLGQAMRALAAANAAAAEPSLVPVPVLAADPAPTSENNLNAQRPVSELELSVRSRKCLQRLGVATIGELIQRSETELMTIKNFGQTSLNEIKQQLTLMGLSLRKRH